MKTPRLTALRALYAIGLAEGTSFLVLLLIGMPLKYIAHQPLAVKVIGPIHGTLFLLYVALVLLSAFLSSWQWTRVLLGVISSVVPFGPFFFDASLKREIETLEGATSIAAR